MAVQGKLATRIREQIRRWRDDLINLSRLNRLLYFRHTKTSTLEIEIPSAAEVIGRLEAAGSRGWGFYVPPSVEEGETPPPPRPSHDELLTSKPDEASLLAALRALERKASQEFMDKGLWVLYLGVGMLEWVDPDDDEAAHSPLWLVPVTVQRENPREPFRLRLAEEDALVNPALAVKLSSNFGIEVPPVEELEETDADSMFDLFRSLTRHHAGWRVTPRLVLSTFSFHKEVMYRDLLKNEEEVAAHPIVQALALGSAAEVDLDFEPVPEDSLDEQEPPEEMVSILDADASQRQCIAAARAGHSFVMDGPPGTGKSQTIANVIAELLTHGKTVLFVSEKAAALEVVHSRLEAAGLGEYILPLHSHKATRREVAQDLGHSLMNHPRPPRGLGATEVRTLIERRKELSAYARALNEVREPLQRSLHEVIGRVSELNAVPQPPSISLPYETLTPERVTLLVGIAASLGRAWGPVARSADFLWQELKESEFGPARVGEISRLLESAAHALGECERLTDVAAGEVGLPWTRSLSEAERLIAMLTLLVGRPEIPVTWLTESTLEPTIGRVAYLRNLADQHRKVEQALMEGVGNNWQQLDHAAAQTIEQSIETINKLKPACILPSQANSELLGDIATFALESSVGLTQIGTEASDIGGRFGLSARGMTLDRARSIAELGSLVGRPSHPEDEWLNPAVFGAVRNACEVLSTLVQDYARKQSELSETFNESILELPNLKDLCVRFETTHKGFGKFKRQCREDRRTIAPCTRSGKAKKHVIGQLRDALSWQEMTSRLKTAEETHAALLGSHYYRREGTDFNALTEAIEIAQRALELAGQKIDVDALRRQLGRNGQPDPDLLPRAQDLLQQIETLTNRAEFLVPAQAAALSNMSIAQAGAWCSAASPEVSGISAVLATAERVFHQPLPLERTRELLAWRHQEHRINVEIAAATEEDLVAIGAGYKGLDTDWGYLDSALVWASEVRSLAEGAVRRRAAERLLASQLPPDDLEAAVALWGKRRDEIASLFANDRAIELVADLDASFDDGQTLMRDLAQSIGDIQEWLAFAAARERLNEEGLEPVATFCIEESVRAESVADVIEKCLLESWVDGVFRKNLGFGLTSRPDRDNCVQEFQDLDRDLVRAASARVIDTCNARRPRTSVGVAGTIVKESQKKKRHMPIRRLIGDTAAVSQALKPCFMMSPLTVSQFLLPSVKFDAVIFDEASQVTPADAINSIYRGQQLIVAGDQKQLPPTSFFERVALEEGDEWEEEQFDEFESVLDLCKGAGGLHSLPLRWHYRSQHEDLITFSNYSFYDGNLITFPGAIETGSDVGVELFQADGIYRRGGPRDNPVEAEKVVERVLSHVRAHPNLTVGVVAFSEAQAATIEIVLERERTRHPELDSYFSEDRLRGFFVKNLENVQGDERDIIIFSVAYGRDEAGKFTLQFGPLNKAGGWRRLNVAITRARRRVEVVSSITSGDFGSELNNPGVRHLKRYLDYCDRGLPALALELSESQLDVESPFEAEVARVVRSWGYDVVPQVGCANYRIDLAIRHPDRPGSFALGIECDGVMYHSSKVARDRDRLRQEVLEGLGWHLHRIWGTAWYRERPAEERRLQEAIERSLEAAGRPPRKPAATAPIIPQLDEVELSEVPDWIQEYQVAKPRRPRYTIEMHEPSAMPDLKRMVNEVLAVESPVHEELVLRRVRETWGAGRAGSRMRQAFAQAVKAIIREGAVERDRAGFLWKVGSEYAVRTPAAADPDTRRTIDEVCIEEIRLAMQWLAEDARLLTRDELSGRVARIFGWTRRGSDIAPVLDEAIADLLGDGVLGDNGSHLEFRGRT